MWRRKRLLEGLDDEMRDHLERETQFNIDRGLSPEEARRQAMLKFGNLALAKEAVRAVWVWVWAEQLIQDIRYALRTLRANRMFAAVVVATLAVAIGMNTAIFSVFNAVVLRPLGYPDADRLVWLSTAHGDGDRGSSPARTSRIGAYRRRRSSAWPPTRSSTTRWSRLAAQRASGRRE